MLKNRIIKFRIWNNKTKQWIHGPHERADMDGVNLFGETILLGELLNGVSIEDLNEVIALQFTGLLDKNGRQIFEGDIMTGRNKPILVYYDPPEFRFKYENNDGGFVSHYIVGWGDFEGEIIGNIFDNPELLNK